MERRIQAFEFRCLRRVLKVPYTEHRANVSIREEITSIMGLHDPLLTIVKKRKMQFYGHTNTPGNLATTILQESVDGKRGRGRPRTTWLKNIADWTGLQLTTATPTLWIVRNGKRRLMLWLMAPPRPRRSRVRGGGGDVHSAKNDVTICIYNSTKQ